MLSALVLETEADLGAVALACRISTRTRKNHMAISPFVFSSDSLPKLKAKQLSTTFRFLKLAVAQEATARALGYSIWYECIAGMDSARTSNGAIWIP